MKTYISNSYGQTINIAKNLATTLTPGSIIAFKGDLGAGKTCFTKGLAEGLGFMGNVTSPTFAIVNEYRGGRLDLFHFDMYRVETMGDLLSCGYFDYLDENGVMALEWSENVENALEGNIITVKIEKLGEDSRKITIG